MKESVIRLTGTGAAVRCGTVCDWVVGFNRKSHNITRPWRLVLCSKALLFSTLLASVGKRSGCELDWSSIVECNSRSSRRQKTESVVGSWSRRDVN